MGIDVCEDHLDRVRDGLDEMESWVPMDIQKLTARNVLICSYQLVPLIFLFFGQLLKAESSNKLGTCVKFEAVDILIICLHYQHAYPFLKVPCDPQILSNTKF